MLLKALRKGQLAMGQPQEGGADEGRGAGRPGLQPRLRCFTAASLQVLGSPRAASTAPYLHAPLPHACVACAELEQGKTAVPHAHAVQGGVPVAAGRPVKPSTEAQGCPLHDM
jgi:hypothetical protein